MNIEFTTDKTDLKRGDTVLYSLSITPGQTNSDIGIEILPSAEHYPDMNIIPDITSVAVSNGLDYTANITDESIFLVDIPQINTNETIVVSFKGVVEKRFEKNTTAVIVTSDNNGSFNEAYTQVTVNGKTSSTAIPIVSALVLISILLLRFAVRQIT